MMMIEPALVWKPGIEAIYGASVEAGDGLDCSLTGQMADDSE